jgi:hypothetical protein
MTRAWALKRVAAAGALATAATMLAACGSQGGTQTLPTSGSTSASTSPPASPAVSSSQAAAAAQQALATYRAAFADWVAVESVPGKMDYHDARLDDHLSGQALDMVVKAVYVNTNVDGGVTKGAPVLNPTIGELVPANAPTQVVINDCVQTDSWLVYTTDGHLYNDVPGGRQKTQALVAYSAGAWKVSQLYIQKVGTC